MRKDHFEGAVEHIVGGPDRGQVGLRPGPNLVQVWTRSGLDLEQIWARSGTGLSQIWLADRGSVAADAAVLPGGLGPR